ncbi:dTDP-glucose 4,6-dehydratase [Evansella tamaricis]|uniref:dTDP-glucose 4,6-dehydratase n=1 Tax=Evansella tamaricis TaxID=2069301 RepID=A0ABS6JES9_9BACI|nr:dTDP-glucose 4,6-dehydratase [Evansella tamaricis]MBU9712174.1 dTDP-glucose 4,6-dehydratase [Evansella tamaricis]
MNLLVTGGAGFIGSNFITYVMKKYPTYSITNLDKLTYAGNIENIKDCEKLKNYHFVKGDICNSSLVGNVIRERKINAIINFAAESHVDRSITSPSIFVKTNVLGTQTLLEAAKEYTIQKYIQISTDEVYGTLGKTGLFTEETTLNPNSPYSASKASGDMMVRAYHQTYGLNVNITRCSNNYGPFQHPEKLIPLMITNAIEDKQLPIYGDGLHIRDWLHVHDHCTALDRVLHLGEPGEIYNIGGNNEKENISIVSQILRILNKPLELIHYVEDRKGHDRRYAIDSSKIHKKLGWEPSIHFYEGLTETILWYKNNKSWWKNVRDM